MSNNVREKVGGEGVDRRGRRNEYMSPREENKIDFSHQSLCALLIK